MAGYRGCNMNNYGQQPVEDIITDLEVLCSWGANILRWQIIGDMSLISTWDATSYQTWLSTQLDQIQSFLPICQQLGLNIVIDMHSPVGGNTTVNGNVTYTIFVEQWATEAYLQNWAMIAQRFRDSTIVIGYDLLNEPQTRSGQTWNTLAAQAAATVYTNDSSKNIIVECIGSSPQGMHSLKPISGCGSIWYSFHLYLPLSIAFQGLPDAHGNVIPIGAPYPSATVNKQSIINALSDAYNFQKQYGGQLFVGEYSCTRWSGYPNSPNAFNYLTDCISIFEQAGWHWTYHAFREAGAWELEYDTTPCPPSCEQPYQVTDRVKLMETAFKQNKSL